MFSNNYYRIHQWLLIWMLIIILLIPSKAVIGFNPDFTFVSTGDSEVSWTDEKSKFGEHAIKFLWTQNEISYVTVTVPPGIKLQDLSSWMYWINTEHQQHPPAIEFEIKKDLDIYQIYLRLQKPFVIVNDWMSISNDASFVFNHYTKKNGGYYSYDESSWEDIVLNFGDSEILFIRFGNHVYTTSSDISAYLDDFTMTTNADTYIYQFEPPAGPPPEVVYVDAAGTCSGQSPCFTTIQAGVDAAANDGTVIVEPGLYSQNINLTKPLKLQGANAGVNPNTQEREPESILEGTFTFASSSVIVDGFQIIGSGEAFVSSGLTDNIQILNNRMIEKTTDQVISNWNDSIGSINWTITNNYIADIQNVGASAIAVKNIDSLSLYGNKIEQVYGNGILFDGAVHNVWIADNFLQFLEGDGIHFTTQPTGTVQIQGNLFKDNMGFGIHAPADLNVAYNSWGKPSGPEPGVDLPLEITSFNPHTYAALEIKPGTGVTANSIEYPDQFTLDVFADLVSVWGAEVNINFPSSHLSIVENGLVSYGVFDFETFEQTAGTIFFRGDQRALMDGEYEVPPGGPLETQVKLLSITFDSLDFGKDLTLDFGEVNFVFAYQGMDVGASNNVYPSSLTGFDNFQIIALPQISTDLVDHKLITSSGIEETFKIILTNPAEGGEFDHLQINFTLNNAEAENIYRFEFFDNGEWKPFQFENDGLGNVIGNLGIEGGVSLQPGETKPVDVRVVFQDSGTWVMDLLLEDMNSSWALDQFAFDIEISLGNLNVFGTVFMQGRRERSGVLISLVSDPLPGLPDQGTVSITSNDLMENNIWFDAVNPGRYQVTVQQPRYLNITPALAKTIDFDSDYTFSMALWLYAGDANDDDKIDISDASIVGSQYGVGGINDSGDVNFDNRVNIQDLALVGGNYRLDSASAYAGWTP